jgi:osmotically inducible lipoprotein OsmB
MRAFPSAGAAGSRRCAREALGRGDRRATCGAGRDTRAAGAARSAALATVRRGLRLSGKSDSKTAGASKTCPARSAPRRPKATVRRRSPSDNYLSRRDIALLARGVHGVARERSSRSGEQAMKIGRTIAAALALSATLGGCASTPTYTQVGTVTGAVVGGVVGSALTGGSTAGTVAGAGAGAAIGYEIGRRMK